MRPSEQCADAPQDEQFATRLWLKERRWELKNEYALQRRHLELHYNLRRETEISKIRIAHRGQTAAMVLAYSILLGSFVIGVVIVALTIVGAIDQSLGEILAVLFVGGSLLGATVKVIQSLTGGQGLD